MKPDSHALPGRRLANPRSQAWTTTNLLRTQVELENQIAKGLKLDLATTLNPEKSTKSAILTAIYKQPSVHTRATADLFKVSSELKMTD